MAKALEVPIAQRFEAQVWFECPGCKNHVTTSVEVAEPDWANAEGQSDMESEGIGEVICPSCRTELSAYIRYYGSGVEIRLDDFPRVEIEADMPHFTRREEEAWIDYALPDDPRSVYAETHQQLAEILSEHGGPGSHIFNRMVFAQQISALEAYLGDTLLKAAVLDSKAIGLLIAQDKELSRQRISLTEVADDPNVVKTRVKAHLKSILYHNLARVQPLYKIVLGLDLFALMGEKISLLQKAIEYRHDCVHRNGFNKDGNRLEVFTREYIMELAFEMKTLVEKIEKAMVKPGPPNDEIEF